jgi:hypothetical protein
MYIGNQPTYGDTTSNFKILDDIASYTETFDGSSASVVSLGDDTLTFNNHRFITGQRVTYSTTGTEIGGLTSGTAYFIIKNDQNTVKLALTQSDAINNNAINFSALGTGTTHTLNVAFDGINTKFKATYDNGTKALFTRAAQLQISINGVIQQPQDTTTPTNGYGFDLDAVIVFSTPPLVTDVFWGNIIANNFAAFDISDNEVDSFTGDGVNDTFTLSRTPPDNNSVLVTIDGVVQYPTEQDTIRAYSVYENIITFTAPPGSATEIQVRHIGFAGAVTSNVTGFYGRTGNVTLTDIDPVVGIQSGGVAIGTVRTLNFIGVGNTFEYNSLTNTIDVSIQGGGGVGAGGTWNANNVGVYTGKSVGVNTTGFSDGLVGTGNSFQGVYVSNGMLIMDNNLNGDHYIGTAYNGLMAGPVTVNGALTIDGVWVVV